MLHSLFLITCIVLGNMNSELLAAETYNTQSSLLDEINKVRQDNEIAPLKPNTLLDKVATQQAIQLQRIGRLTHYGEKQEPLGLRLTNQGYLYKACAENLASGQATERQVVTTWLNSSGHRDNMLEPIYTHAGIGTIQSKSGPYWVLILATNE